MPKRANSLLDEYFQASTRKAEMQYYKRSMAIIENHLQLNTNPLTRFLHDYICYFQSS